MSLLDELYAESGLPSVMDVLGESVAYLVVLTRECIEGITASVGPKEQREVLTEDRETRVTMRRFTFSTDDVANPAHNDEITLGSEVYVVDKVESKADGRVRVMAWQKLSIEKTRRGQRGTW